MTATAERARGWNLRRLFRPTTRPAAPAATDDPTPAGAAVAAPLPTVYASEEHEPGMATVALGWGRVREPATEDTGERTRIIARFDADPDQLDEPIPPLADGADLLPPAIYHNLVAALGDPALRGVS